MPLGTFAPQADDAMAGFRRSGAFVSFTPIANLTGLPAMSVPLHWNDAGLPIGSHFLARFGAEDVLFPLAAQLEAAHPWADRRPPHAHGA